MIVYFDWCGFDLWVFFRGCCRLALWLSGLVCFDGVFVMSLHGHVLSSLCFHVFVLGESWWKVACILELRFFYKLFFMASLGCPIVLLSTGSSHFFSPV